MDFQLRSRNFNSFNFGLLNGQHHYDVVGIFLLTIGMSLDDNQLLSSVIACYSYSNKLCL